MKNVYCVGQKVIENSLELGRVNRTVTRIISNKAVLLDNSKVCNNDDIMPLHDFLDPTNFAYHHRRFGDAISIMNSAFSHYRFIQGELDEIRQSTPDFDLIVNPKHFKYLTFLNRELAIEAAEIERGYAVYRTAQYNLAQWGEANNRPTLDHHFQFLNPEEIENY